MLKFMPQYVLSLDILYLFHIRNLNGVPRRGCDNCSLIRVKTVFNHDSYRISFIDCLVGTQHQEKSSVAKSCPRLFRDVFFGGITIEGSWCERWSSKSIWQGTKLSSLMELKKPPSGTSSSYSRGGLYFFLIRTTVVARKITVGLLWI